MDKKFINKVKLIILEHIEDENFNVSDLADEMGLGYSQILRKIRASTGKSVNQYIREIRLQEAAKLIQENEYTASEISYKVGFGSPSYFNKCFHDYFGFTPGEYKEQDGEKIKKIVDGSESVEPNFFKKPKVIYATILFATVVLLISFFVNRNSIRKKKLQNSIAVLYFDDISSTGDTQWFSDGITDEIYTSLSKLKNLKVISQTSVKKFKNSDISIPKIAKELDVSFIVEGSVKKYSDMVRITVRLFNSYDEPIWSQEYDIKMGNVLKIQREVSKKIVQELQIIISPEEERLLNSFPTDNLKAYGFYLKARGFAQIRSKEYFDLSIDHYEQAIDLDPNFSDAYAEMALTYLNNKWVDNTNWPQNKNKASSLIDQALRIDPNSAKAFSAKGKLYFHDKKFKEAIYNFKRAIKLNPNDAIIHRDIAIYYIRGYTRDVDKSIYHINKAVALDPFSANINQRKIFILLKLHRIIEAEELYNNKRTLFSEQVKIEIQDYFTKAKAKIIGLEKKDMMEVIKFYHKMIREEPENAKFYSDLGNAYKGILNDNDNFIKYNKKAYTLSDSTNSAYKYWYAIEFIIGENFKEAEILMNSNNYKNFASDVQQLYVLSKYYYFKEDYETAMKIVNKPLMIKNNYYYIKTLLLAQKGDVEEVREILNNNFFHHFQKVKVFAILKQRDSMYYYINKIKARNLGWLNEINGSKEMNPYRKEERYKAFLKKNYLPITHWNK